MDFLYDFIIKELLASRPAHQVGCGRQVLTSIGCSWLVTHILRQALPSKLFLHFYNSFFATLMVRSLTGWLKWGELVTRIWVCQKSPRQSEGRTLISENECKAGHRISAGQKQLVPIRGMMTWTPNPSAKAKALICSHSLWLWTGEEMVAELNFKTRKNWVSVDCLPLSAHNSSSHITTVWLQVSSSVKWRHWHSLSRLGVGGERKIPPQGQAW